MSWKRKTVELISIGAVLVVAAPFATAFAADENITLAISMRSLSNPYHATFAKGGEDFAKSIGAPSEVLVTEGNSEWESPTFAH